MKYFADFKERFERIKNDPFFDKYVSDLKEYYKEQKAQPLPQEKFTEFNLYFTTGNRRDHEIVYFKKRQRMTAALLLWLLYREREYLDELCNMIWIICSEVTWVLPAHTYHCKNGYRTGIDLFGAETGLYLAEILYLVGDDLPSNLRSLIKKEIKERNLDAYENYTFDWERYNSNWNAVINGSIGMTYMYLDPDGFERHKERMFNSLNHFLNGFTDDGCCTEGVMYWFYGFGFYFMFAEMLYNYSDGKEDIIHTEKIEKVAHYLERVIMRNNLVVNFADSMPSVEFGDIGFLCRLRDFFPDISVPKCAYPKVLGSEQLKPNTHLRNMLWTDSKVFTEAKEKEDFTHYFECAQVYHRRKKDFSFAAKAGHNHEEHNHNDVGHFIVADDGGQILADIGMMEYTRQNFGPERFTLTHNNSFGHSVPIINGEGQQFGREFCGEVIEQNENGISMKINKAYGPDVPEIVRSFKIGDDGITMTDTFAEREKYSVTERFVTRIEPEITDGGVKVGNALLKMTGTPYITTETISGHWCQPEQFWFINCDIEDNEFTLTVEL